MSEIRIDKDSCIGCGTCVPGCLGGALEVKDGLAVVDYDKCLLCGACVTACPAGAVSMTEEDKKGSGGTGSRLDIADSDGTESLLDIADCRGIWVFAEQEGGRVSEAVLELLSVARGLAADAGQELCAVMIGAAGDENPDGRAAGDENPDGWAAGTETTDDRASGAADLLRYGAQKVYILENDALAVPNEEVYGRLLTDLIIEEKPAVVLYPATSFGRSLAPRVAAALKTGLTADCTGLAIDKETGLLMQIRPAFGGNVMATIICPQRRPQMATVRPRVFRKSLPSQTAEGSVIVRKVEVDEALFLSRILEVTDRLSSEIRIEDASVVVAGGAGCQSKEAFALVRQLADALGGVVGASRAAVDLGYAPPSAQVGQTGKVIAPKLYIACGISGAIQHLVGMENADLIAAVNKDPDAPIFQAADICLVGDLGEILPALTEAVLRYKAAGGPRQ